MGNRETWAAEVSADPDLVLREIVEADTEKAKREGYQYPLLYAATITLYYDGLSVPRPTKAPAPFEFPFGPEILTAAERELSGLTTDELIEFSIGAGDAEGRPELENADMVLNVMFEKFCDLDPFCD